MPSSPSLLASNGCAKCQRALALAEVFAAKGHDLILVARSADKLAAAAADLQGRHGIRCEWLLADLQQADAAQALSDTVQQNGWSVDVLVNNAGVLHEGLFDSIPLERHLGLLQINVLAATALCHLFLPPMLAAGHGRLLNICSTSSFNPVPSLATYAARECYAACMAGQAVKINGLMNRVSVETLRHPPMWLKRELIGPMERWGI